MLVDDRGRQVRIGIYGLAIDHRARPAILLTGSHLTKSTPAAGPFLVAALIGVSTRWKVKVLYTGQSDREVDGVKNL